MSCKSEICSISCSSRKIGVDLEDEKESYRFVCSEKSKVTEASLLSFIFQKKQNNAASVCLFFNNNYSTSLCYCAPINF